VIVANTACTQIRVPAAPSVRDAFVSELVKLSPPFLKTLDLSSARNLHQFVLAPAAACPALETLNLRECQLEFVLIQSNSLMQLVRCAKKPGGGDSGRACVHDVPGCAGLCRAACWRCITTPLSWHAMR
jgi:hypothetical protein